MTADDERAALARLNQQKSWLAANRAWLAALAVAFALGFIIAHI